MEPQAPRHPQLEALAPEELQAPSGAALFKAAGVKAGHSVDPDPCCLVSLQAEVEIPRAHSKKQDTRRQPPACQERGLHREPASTFTLHFYPWH